MKKDKNKQLQKAEKKETSIVRSSAAEYLTFVAASGQGGVEAVYADENIWLTQKMMGGRVLFLCLLSATYAAFRLGATVAKRNEKLVKLLDAIGDLPLSNGGGFTHNTIDLFGDA